MATSYNGWQASRDPNEIGIAPFVVQGESFPAGVKGGDVATVFRYVVEQFHLRVEPLVRWDWHAGDDWGYYYRPNVNNPDVLSCHSSGTALDINATRHPNGQSGTFTRAQITAIRAILAEVSNVVFWGGDFGGTPDDMHFEIRGSAAAVAAVARRLTTNPTITTAPTEDEMNDTQWAAWKASDDGQRRDLREMGAFLNKIAAKVGVTERLEILKPGSVDGTIES